MSPGARQRRRERDAARKRELRRYRVANRICVRCGAKLQDEDTTQSCVECLIVGAAACRRYWRTHPEMARRSRRNWFVTNRERANANRRAWRLRKKIAGICLDCTLAHVGDSPYCEYHREYHRVKDLHYRRRKDPTAKRRLVGRQKLPKKPRVPKRRVTGITPISIVRDRAADYDLETVRGRILRALRFLDWSTNREILEVAGFSQEDHSNWDAATQMLSRIARFSKLLERIGRRGDFRFRLTAAGRAAVERMIKETIRDVAA